MAGERILVVDDEPQVLLLMSRFLRRSGYKVVAAENGAIALEHLQREPEAEAETRGREPFDLVLSDLKMPRVDGLRVLQEVKKRYPDTMVVLVTGFATTDSAVAALRQGAYDYLTKPLDLDDLLSTVRRALEHRALVLQNKRLIEFLKEKNVVLEFLHQEEQRRSEQLRQVNAIARQITAILDEEALVKTVVELIAPTFDFVNLSFGLIKGDELYFREGRLDGKRARVLESGFWQLTDGGKRPYVQRRSGQAVGGEAIENDGAVMQAKAGLAADEGMSYELIFPLRAGDQIVGFWVADWKQEADFREENLPYLESLAAQTVVVLENARLYALARQADELAFLNKVSQAANRSLNLEETIRSVLTCVQSAFSVSLVEICLVGEHKEIDQVFTMTFHATATDGVYWQGKNPLLGKEFVQQVIENPTGVHICRADELRSAAREPVPVGHAISQHSAVSGQGSSGLGSILGVSLRFGERQIGVLGIANTEPSLYDLESGHLLQVVGGQAATAIENARLFQEVESGRRVILESRNTLQTLFDGILEGIYIVDRHNTVLAINRTQANWAGKGFRELVGHPAELAFPSSHRPLELIQETFSTGSPMSCTERRRTSAEVEQVALDHDQPRGLSGEWTEWQIHTYPVASSSRMRRQSGLDTTGGDGSGYIDRVVVVVRDVTEQRLLEASLIQSEKLAAVGTLAAGIAHEINNPMTVVSANAQILREEIPSSHPYYGSIQLIDRAAERASRIVRNLLDFSRTEQFEFVLTDLNLSLGEAISLVEPQFRRANIQIVSGLGPDVPAVWASPDHLHVVWLNLLLNARDAIEEIGCEGKIQVTSHRRGEWVDVHISDNGVGIPDDMISHVYDPFFTTKGPSKGTGLGLFTCYRTVIRHGGEINIDSQVGKGTVFHISLPVHEGSAPG